jgi:hypothetical protein
MREETVSTARRLVALFDTRDPGGRRHVAGAEKILEAQP